MLNTPEKCWPFNTFNWQYPNQQLPIQTVCSFLVNMAFIDENKVVRVSEFFCLYLVACPDPLICFSNWPSKCFQVKFCDWRKWDIVVIETETPQAASSFCSTSSRYIDGLDSKSDFRYHLSLLLRISALPIHFFKESVCPPYSSLTVPRDTFRWPAISLSTKLSCCSWMILCFVSIDNAGVMTVVGRITSSWWHEVTIQTDDIFWFRTFTQLCKAL